MVTDSAPEQAQVPLIRRPDEGLAWWWFNSLTLVKAGASETGGRLTVLDVTEPPHEQVPLHVHHREDESFYILDGSAEFVIGDLTVGAKAGDFLYGPRGIPHRYTVGADGCRMLFILTPGGLDEMVAGMSQPAERLELPAPSDEEPDWEQIASLAERYGNEVLG
jgi:mannose-6-phosphate isomerase-like protein (cupin superfamily)